MLVKGLRISVCVCTYVSRLEAVISIEFHLKGKLPWQNFISYIHTFEQSNSFYNDFFFCALYNESYVTIITLNRHTNK